MVLQLISRLGHVVYKNGRIRTEGLRCQNTEHQLFLICIGCQVAVFLLVQFIQRAVSDKDAIHKCQSVVCKQLLCGRHIIPQTILQRVTDRADSLPLIRGRVL